jgi:hypothetical protein
MTTRPDQVAGLGVTPAGGDAGTGADAAPEDGDGTAGDARTGGGEGAGAGGAGAGGAGADGGGGDGAGWFRATAGMDPAGAAASAKGNVGSSPGPAGAGRAPGTVGASEEEIVWSAAMAASLRRLMIPSESDAPHTTGAACTTYRTTFWCVRSMT